MLLLAAAKKNSEVPARQQLRKLYSSSPIILFQRQNSAMSIVMKERWTEAEIAALPAGEHDYFDRKSGALLTTPDFRKDMGKALSAFANSGGGHLILGVKDDGTIDGVDKIKKGRVTTRDWLEQTIPNLLVFPLQQFRVHEVEPSSPSAIPADRVVIVVDVGDSTLAPHQAEDSKIYYFRQAGRSLPAPHFYLETLRNRLLSPLLEAELMLIEYQPNARQVDTRIFLEITLKYTIVNQGRTAAYRWRLVVEQILGIPPERQNDYILDKTRFPPITGPRHSFIDADPTILPSLAKTDVVALGLFLNTSEKSEHAIVSELELAIPTSVEIVYRVVSEFSPGQTKTSKLSTFLNIRVLARQIMQQIR
jgi:Schlafen, AlbA_2